MCSCATQGGEDEREKKPEHNLQPPIREIRPLKRILRDPPVEESDQSKKRVRTVKISDEPPSLLIPPGSGQSFQLQTQPNRQFIGTNIILERMCESQNYFMIIRIIYDDAEAAGILKIDGRTRDDANQVVKKMQKTRQYAEKKVNFGDYIIRKKPKTDPSNPETDMPIIGRFMFTNYIFGTTQDEGFLQTHFHLTTEFRGQGLGFEALECLKEHLIVPNIGKKGLFMKSVLPQTPEDDDEKVGTFENTLKGVYGKSNLLRSDKLDIFAVIATYFKAGFGVKLMNGEVIMSYPLDSYPPGPSLLEGDVRTVVTISKLMQNCREIKMRNKTLVQLKSEPVPEEVTIELSEILRNETIYATQLEALKKQYHKLLATTEPFTFLSALNILHTHFNMSKEALNAFVSAEKASSMCSLLDKIKNPPNGLFFLRLFRPFSLQLSSDSSPLPLSFH